MAWLTEQSPQTPARALIVSQRAAGYQVSRALYFEFEDLVRSLDGADLISFDRVTPRPAVWRRASSLLERVVPGGSSWMGDAPAGVGARYELVLVAIRSLSDLLLLPPLSWLLRRAHASVCLVDEVWTKGLRRRTGELSLLRQFDRLILGAAGAVDAIAELTGRPCSYLPPSVDALGLCPYPDPVPRPIDVYAMGRRSPATHEALLRLAERDRIFYLRDTLTGLGVRDPRDHRRHLAELLKRTRFLLAYAGKIDAPEEIGDQQEIGYRYFEGAAAGAVLLGEAPATPWFETLFGWRDAVVTLPYGTGDPDALVAAMAIGAQREETIRRTNVVESLRRHDHVYRWAEILRLVGMPETPAMELRRRQLRALADEVARGALAGRVTAS